MKWLSKVDPFEEIYGARGSNIWAKEGEKVVNPDAFTSDFLVNKSSEALKGSPRSCSL